MRKCPFNDCDKKIPEDMFACRGHWFSLSRIEKLTIHRAYSAYLADRIDVPRLRDIQQRVLGKRGTACSPEEESVKRALEDIEAGRCRPLDDVAKELGL